MNTNPHINLLHRNKLPASTPTQSYQPPNTTFTNMEQVANKYVYVNQFNPNCQEIQPSATAYGNAHIISPNKQAPDGYVCVGRLVESERQSSPVSNSKNTKKAIYVLAETSNLAMHQPIPQIPTQQYINTFGTNVVEMIPESAPITEFPSTFNPRLAANMPVNEKVTTWMQRIPLSLNHENESHILKCYSGIVPSSSDSEHSCIDNSEIQDVIEFQARRVTKFVTKMYKNEAEMVAHRDISPTELESSLPFYTEDLMHLENSVDSYLQN